MEIKFVDDQWEKLTLCCIDYLMNLSEELDFEDQRIDTAKSEFYFTFIIYKLIFVGCSALIFLVLRGGTQDFVIIIKHNLTNQL
jgi:hypothetical protein